MSSQAGFSGTLGWREVLKVRNYILRLPVLGRSDVRRAEAPLEGGLNGGK